MVNKFSLILIAKRLSRAGFHKYRNKDTLYWVPIVTLVFLVITGQMVLRGRGRN